MLTSRIYEAALSYGAEESEGLETICAAAEAELAARLKDGISAEDCGDVFVTAAAFIAIAMTAELRSVSDGIESYSAGNVSVRKKDGASSKVLRERAESIMAQYTTDGGFCFMGVGE